MKKIFDEEEEIVRTTLYWTREYADYLREYAHLNRTSMSKVIRALIDKLANREVEISKE
jgi:hypothetical protein